MIGFVDKGFNSNSYGKMVAVGIRHEDKPKQIKGKSETLFVTYRTNDQCSVVPL
jgi:hypothetical protein